MLGKIEDRHSALPDGLTPCVSLSGTDWTQESLPPCMRSTASLSSEGATSINCHTRIDLTRPLCRALPNRAITRVCRLMADRSIDKRVPDDMARGGRDGEIRNRALRR